jgi:hypothetical protein
MDNVVYVISPEPWDGFKVSKHHYAVELAQRGNEVYFIDNSRTTGVLEQVDIRESGVDGLRVVAHSGFLLRWLRFRKRALYDRLSRWHVNRVINAIGKAPAIVWDFDNTYQFADLRLFGDCLKIFHPVDSLMSGRNDDKKPDVILSVSQQFIDRLDTVVSRTMVVPHGLNESHAAYARRIVEGLLPLPSASKTALVVGYVGNLDLPGIDWPTIVRMIEAYRSIEFRFIGPYGKPSPQNRGSPMPVELLRSLPNCRLTGIASIEEVLVAANDVDVWLLCNDRKYRPDGGINAHKLLEYLATGKAVLSNAVEAFEGTDLLTMPDSAENNNMPAMLGEMLDSLERINSPEVMRNRAAYALQFSYARHVDQIDGFLRVFFGDKYRLTTQDRRSDYLKDTATPDMQ